MTNTEHPIENLSQALNAALYRDLPNIQYRGRDWDAFRDWETNVRSKMSVGERTKIPSSYMDRFLVDQERRPETREVEVRMFPQTWASTALGYGGLGGAAVTTAYTVVVSTQSVACIYFGGNRLAYRVENYRACKSFVEDLTAGHLASRSDAVIRYGVDDAAVART